MAADQLKLLKTERANTKRRMTTTLHVTEALISEQNFEQIDQIKLQELRVQFIDSHTAYGDALVNSGADIDDIEFLDEYVKQVMERYNRVLRDSKPTLIHDEQLPQPAAMLTREELAATIASMQCTVKTFSGACTEFQLFICRHNQAVKHITSYETKLAKLLDSLDGEALRSVAGCAVIGGKDGYYEAMTKLESRFGDRHKVMNALMNDLDSAKTIRTPQQIQAFADDLYNARLSFNVMHCLDELTPKFVARVCERLPNDHAKRWRGIAMDHKSRFDEYPGFSVFVDFVQRLAQDVNDPLYGYAVESPTRPVDVCKRAHTVSHNMTATLNNGSLHKCPMCKSVHRLTQCPIFKNEGMESRLDFVNTHNLCYICLLDNHVTNDCLSKRSCAICDESWHNTLLHQNSSTAAVVSNNNIVVSDLNDSQRINLSRVYATESIPVPRVQIDLDQLKHLDGVTPGDPSDVGMLLGEDCGSMLLPLETRVGRSDEPYAARISHGWYIAGPTRMGSVADECCANLCVVEPSAERCNKLWGIDHELADIKSMSVEVSKVIKGWDKECELIEGHVQLPISWKQEPPDLPDNYEMADKRLVSLRETLDHENRDELYDVEINMMLINAYAEHVPPDTLDVAPLEWYTPHDYVPKHDNRIRVVHDCAAIYQGHPLTDAVYGGPYINNGLLGVLLRFSLNEHAMAAMVRIPSRDRNALCFLWYDNALHLSHLRVTCHLYGGVWSGSAAVSLKKCIAISDPDLVIVMSDCIPRVRGALAGAGFSLTKYNCTRQNVMPLDSTCDIDPKEPSLSSTDTNALGIYDPLISPLVLSGRLILQETVVPNLDWAASLSCDVAVMWLAWRRNVQRLQDLRIPRPILPCFPNSTTLYHFADASNSGYGCITHLFAIDQHGIVTSTLLYSSTRVAPLVQHTIQRFELGAAVLAIQVDATLTRDISADIDIQSSVYWTDGMIVLAYLHVDSKHYHTFVGNRVARIRSHSEASQWCHVQSEQNPTDLASLVYLILQAVNGSMVANPSHSRKVNGHPVRNWSQC